MLCVSTGRYKQLLGQNESLVETPPLSPGPPHLAQGSVSALQGRVEMLVGEGAGAGLTQVAGLMADCRLARDSRAQGPWVPGSPWGRLGSTQRWRQRWQQQHGQERDGAEGGHRWWRPEVAEPGCWREGTAAGGRRGRRDPRCVPEHSGERLVRRGHPH